MCPPPITTCGGADGAECPPGYECACVPSCPACRDCAAQVCVAAPSRECRTACDCELGLGCFDGQCIAGFAPVFCCDRDRCPVGQQCQHEDGHFDLCQPSADCRTACDCDPGLGCVDGQCIAGVAPVFCCEGDRCPADQQCQHRDGRSDQCKRDCVDQLWLCDASEDRACGEGRVCSCSATCPACEDCGPNVCLPEGSPTPYRCNADGSCSQAGDRCACVSSCPECDDCAMNLCVPSCNNPCDELRSMAMNRIERVMEHTRPCISSADCVRIDTSTGCQGSCGTWVHKRYAERVQRFVGHVDQRYCSNYRAHDCPYVAPRCQAEVGACVRGQCTGEPFPVSERSDRKRPNRSAR